MSVFNRYILPALATVGVLFGIVIVVISMKKPSTPPIPFPPPASPFKNFVAGVGQVEAASENISIGAPFTEIVSEVFVESGDMVNEGDPLFKLDTRVFTSELREAKAAVDVARANYRKMLDLPRPEDVPPLVASYEAAKWQHEEDKERFDLYQSIENPKAISQESYIIRKYQSFISEAGMRETRGKLDLLLSGAWSRDLEISRAEMKQAKAKMEIIQTNIARSMIRAPYDGQVLVVNVHKGEVVQTGVLEQDLILFGIVQPAHLRVDIDEEDVWRVMRGAPGIAFVRGNSRIHVPLDYVKIEPFLIPKQILTGDDTEKVDTRVLQIIYKFEINDLPIFFGQIMDVFLEAKPYDTEQEKYE
ncbi:MAG: biotin/lipoyl-binding protein [Chlamydiia bacterium]|nr:biotin/lipoyl-binding protein [Chlamydiia bacterium]